MRLYAQIISKYYQFYSIIQMQKYYFSGFKYSHVEYKPILESKLKQVQKKANNFQKNIILKQKRTYTYDISNDRKIVLRIINQSLIKKSFVYTDKIYMNIFNMNKQIQSNKNSNKNINNYPIFGNINIPANQDKNKNMNKNMNHYNNQRNYNETANKNFFNSQSRNNTSFNGKNASNNKQNNTKANNNSPFNMNNVFKLDNQNNIFYTNKNNIQNSNRNIFGTKNINNNTCTNTNDNKKDIKLFNLTEKKNSTSGLFTNPNIKSIFSNGTTKNSFPVNTSFNLNTNTPNTNTNTQTKMISNNVSNGNPTNITLNDVNYAAQQQMLRQELMQRDNKINMLEGQINNLTQQLNNYINSTNTNVNLNNQTQNKHSLWTIYQSPQAQIHKSGDYTLYLQKITLDPLHTRFTQAYQVKIQNTHGKVIFVLPIHLNQLTAIAANLQDWLEITNCSVNVKVPQLNNRECQIVFYDFMGYNTCHDSARIQAIVQNFCTLSDIVTHNKKMTPQNNQGTLFDKLYDVEFNFENGQLYVKTKGL